MGICPIYTDASTSSLAIFLQPARPCRKGRRLTARKPERARPYTAELASEQATSILQSRNSIRQSQKGVGDGGEDGVKATALLLFWII